MITKNFYDDILAICKQFDKQEGKKFEAWQFKFNISSQPCTTEGHLAA